MGDRAKCRSWDGLEECRVRNTEYGHYECPVEKIVAHLAGGLSHQRAAMASGAMKPPAFKAFPRRMMRADGIVRAKRAHPQSLRQMIFDVPGLLHEATEGALRIWTSRIKENPELLGLSVRVDPLANRTSGIAAMHRERLDEEMRQCVQQNVWPTGEWALTLPVFRPVLVSTR